MFKKSCPFVCKDIQFLAFSFQRFNFEFPHIPTSCRTYTQMGFIETAKPAMIITVWWIQQARGPEFGDSQSETDSWDPRRGAQIPGASKGVPDSEKAVLVLSGNAITEQKLNNPFSFCHLAVICLLFCIAFSVIYKYFYMKVQYLKLYVNVKCACL